MLLDAAAGLVPCALFHKPFPRKRASARAPRGNVLSCRVAGLDWRSARVYFLAFLNPSRGQPVPALTVRLACVCHGR
jgi:hypothetical protein